jgi:CheY-like chemotaxis protein
MLGTSCPTLGTWICIGNRNFVRYKPLNSSFMLAQLKVVLADDDVDDNLFFTHSLKRLSLTHKVIYAKNYLELFHVLEHEPDLDLAILDIRMPGKDGKQCLREIKAHTKHRKIPVIIMTNSKNTSDIEETFEAGAHYYVIKPYSLINYVETMKLIFNINWKTEQPVPPKEKFIINLAFA